MLFSSCNNSIFYLVLLIAFPVNIVKKFNVVCKM